MVFLQFVDRHEVIPFPLFETHVLCVSCHSPYVPTGAALTIGGNPLAEAVRNEFTSSMQKFVSQISQTIEQVTGDVHLVVPTVTIDNPREAARKPDVVSTLEQVAEKWVSTMMQVLTQESHKQLVGTGMVLSVFGLLYGCTCTLFLCCYEPMYLALIIYHTSVCMSCAGPISEINFWRSRNAALSGIFEQLQAVQVKKILSTLEEAGSDVMTVFKEQMLDLTKLYVEGPLF